jgi:hypothetical protein
MLWRCVPGARHGGTDQRDAESPRAGDEKGTGGEGGAGGWDPSNRARRDEQSEDEEGGQFAEPGERVVDGRAHRGDGAPAPKAARKDSGR